MFSSHLLNRRLTSRDYYNFAYKDMGETMGPEARCPVGILKCLSQTENKTALAWRRKMQGICRASKKISEKQRKTECTAIIYMDQFRC